MCVGHNYPHASTDNVNKTWGLWQTTVGKDEPTIVCMRIVVSNAHCVAFFVFLFGFYSLPCVTCVASFYGLSMLCYHFSILYRLLTLAH